MVFVHKGRMTKAEIEQLQNGLAKILLPFEVVDAPEPTLPG